MSESSNRSGQPVVLVTGAAGRLGVAVAVALARRGASLVLSDIDAARLEAGAQSVALPTGRISTRVADLGDDSSVEQLVEGIIADEGRLDACVNCAGIEGPVRAIEDVRIEEFQRVFDINVFAVFRVMHAIIPHFKRQRRGRIVNVASGAGLAGSGYMAAYSASKHAVIGLTRSVAREVAPLGVAVNAVCPGCVESPMMGRIEADLERLTGAPVSFVGDTPMGRYARPEEVADMVAYLVLDAPIYITGAALVIDGGLRA